MRDIPYYFHIIHVLEWDALLFFSIFFVTRRGLTIPYHSIETKTFFSLKNRCEIIHPRLCLCRSYENSFIVCRSTAVRPPVISCNFISYIFCVVCCALCCELLCIMFSTICYNGIGSNNNNGPYIFHKVMSSCLKYLITSPTDHIGDPLFILVATNSSYRGGTASKAHDVNRKAYVLIFRLRHILYRMLVVFCYYQLALINTEYCTIRIPNAPYKVRVYYTGRDGDTEIAHYIRNWRNFRLYFLSGYPSQQPHTCDLGPRRTNLPARVPISSWVKRSHAA